MSQPLLFLDVDGVLNCLGAGHPRHILGDLPCEVPAKTKTYVSQLLPLFDPIWATAWQGAAHRAWRELLELPETSWPYVPYGDLKLPALIRFAAGRPFAWVDDDAEWELRSLGWTHSMVDGLIVSPDPRVGLTAEIVTDLRGFAASTQQPQPPETLGDG